jgi:hypothetical protein
MVSPQMAEWCFCAFPCVSQGEPRFDNNFWQRALRLGEQLREVNVEHSVKQRGPNFIRKV